MSNNKGPINKYGMIYSIIDFMREASFLIMAIITIGFHNESTLLLVASQLFFIMMQYISSIKFNDAFTLEMRHEIKKYLIWGGSFAAYALISYVWAMRNDTVISCGASIIQVVLLGSAIMLYAEDDLHYQRAIRYLTIAGFILCVRLMIVVPPTAYGTERIGTYIGYRHVGITYNLGYVSLLSFDEGIRKRKPLYIVASIIMIAFSSLSGSKKALIIAGVAVPLIIILRAKNQRKMLRNVLITIFVIIAAVYAFSNIPALRASAVQRFEAMIYYLEGAAEDGSTEARANVAKYALEYFCANPINGIGLDSLRYVNPEGIYAHNNYLEMLSCLGLVGFVLYYWLPFLQLKESYVYAFRDRRKDCVTSAIVLFVILLMDMTSVSYSLEPIHMVMALLFANNFIRADESEAERISDGN